MGRRLRGKATGTHTPRERGSSPSRPNHLTEAQRGYIAALIDGEGTVRFEWYRASKNGKRYQRSRVSISNTNWELLEWVRETLGYGKVYLHRDSRPGNKKCWRYQVTARLARLLAAEVLPHLRLKAMIAREMVVGRI